jgi:drug/metabolite transporter (DMT)-like permease
LKQDVAPHRARVVGYAFVSIAAMSWGAWPLLLRNAKLAPALASAIVMLVTTLVSAVVMLRDRVARRAEAREWAGIVWLGVADACNISLFFGAYQRTSVAIAVLTHYLAPIFVAVAAPLVVRERAHGRTLFAVAIAFFGLLVLLRPWDAHAGTGAWIGAAMGAGSAFFYASNVLVNKRLNASFSGSELMFFHGIVSTPLLFLLVPTGEFGRVSPDALKLVLMGAFGPGALSGLLFVWGLRRVPASQASVLTLLEPLVAVVLAALFMQEPLGLLGITGGGLVLVGAALVMTTKQRKTDGATVSGLD